MYAWLIVNGFYKSAKCNELYSFLTNAAAKRGIDLKLLYNTQFCDPSLFDPAPRPEFIIFWDKDIRLAERLEEKGFRLYNTSRAIALSDDKSATYRELVNAGISTPRTIIAPMTFAGIGYCELSFMDDVEKELSYPMVVKEAFGSYGAQVYLCGSREEVAEVLKKTDGRTVIFQDFIKESRGRDIRINVVGDRIVTSMMRYNNNDFRANITNGGSMKAYTPTEAECQAALNASHALGLDFSGVDILFGNNGPVVVEVNSNAHFKNIFDCTGVNVADTIIGYILNERQI